MDDQAKGSFLRGVATGNSEEPSRDPGDRKYHLRHALNSFIDLHRDGHSSVSGMVIEISEVGMSAIVPEELQKGERVMLSFELPLRKISIDGIVHYSHKFRHGFRFTNVTADQQRQLREACARLPVYCRDKIDDTGSL